MLNKNNQEINLYEQNKDKLNETQIINTTICNTTNNLINNTLNNQNNIIINQIGKEKFGCLDMKDIFKIANDKLNGPITCIKKLNFNKKLPENHSFCNTSLEGNYFTTINIKTKKPEKISKKDLTCKLLNSSLKFIEDVALTIEFDEDFKQKVHKEYQEKIQYILDNKHKFYEKKNINLFFDSINSMSYNYKDLILSTWEILQTQPTDNNSDSNSENNSDSEPDIKFVEYHPDNDSDSDLDNNIVI